TTKYCSNVRQDAAVTPDLERKSDETEEVNIEEKEASNVKSGETEELDLETTQSTALFNVLLQYKVLFPSMVLLPLKGLLTYKGLLTSK
ncbi:hypothetical protein Tco_0395873, partial [Tanacetum coccineum]